MSTLKEESLNEISEELEESNTKEDLIVKKKYPKKKGSKLNKALLKFLIISIVLAPIIYILFTIYNSNISSKKNNYEMSPNTKDKNKLTDLNLKIKHIINNSNDYTKFGVKKRNFQ